MNKQVAIILLNWNTPQHTSNCIVSLMQQCDAESYDLIIADNGSTDGSLDVLRSWFPQHIYIDNKENLGFAGGNNRALEYSIAQGYPYSLLLNSDTEVEEDFLSPMLRHLERHPTVTALQPAIYFLHQKDQLWNGGSFFNQIFGITYAKNQKNRQALKEAEPVDWLTGCCFLVRNAALKRAGLLKEKFFLYYEDVELSFRLREQGYTLQYFPATKIFHEAGVSGKQPLKNKEGVLSPVIHYYLCRNKIWFLRRYGNPIFAPMMIFYHGFYYAALFTYFFLRGRRKKSAYLLQGIKEGLNTPLNSIWP